MKGSSVATYVLATVASFTLGEELSGKNWIGIIVSAICLVWIARIKSRPAQISAESDAKLNERAQSQKETAELFTRMQEIHGEEKKLLSARLFQQNQLLAVLTITKHALAGELNAANLFALDRGEILARAQLAVKHGETPVLDFAPYKPKDIRELTGAEDKVRAQIVGLDVDAILK